MALAYTVTLPNPPGVPASVVVRIVAMREDDKKLSREELSALAAAYPPPTEASRKAVESAIHRARSRPTETAKPRVKNTRTKATPKAAAKRKAAKRPPRAR